MILKNPSSSDAEANDEPRSGTTLLSPFRNALHWLRETVRKDQEKGWEFAYFQSIQCSSFHQSLLQGQDQSLKMDLSDQTETREKKTDRKKQWNTLFFQSFVDIYPPNSGLAYQIRVCL